MTLSNKPDWKIDKTHPELVESLVLGLSAVLDPDLGYSVLELGLVRDIFDRQRRKRGEYSPHHSAPMVPYAGRNPCQSPSSKSQTIEYGSEAWKPEMMDPELRDDEWGLLGF